MGKRKGYANLIFILPMVIMITLFVYFPMISSFRTSLYSTNLIEYKYLGLLQYKLLFADKMFWDSILNTLIMMSYTLIIGIPVSYIIASLINLIFGGKSFFKVMFYLPNLTSIVVAVLVMKYIFNSTDVGIINSFLRIFGFQNVPWMTDPGIKQLTTALISVWICAGYNALLFLAGMQVIPSELYNAAEVDGANSFRKWLYITIPGTSKVLFFVFLTGVINGMQRFTDVWMLTGGAGISERSMMTVVFYMYAKGFMPYIGAIDFGTSYAVGVILFLMILILSVFIMRKQKFDEN